MAVRMTWRDIKLATLQKMFAAEGSTIPTDESTEDYIAAMPYAANEGIHRLVTAGKPIVNSYAIAHYPVPNLLGNEEGYRIDQVEGEKTYSAVGAKAYYFQFAGSAAYTVKVGDTVVETNDAESRGTYTEYRGSFSNDEGEEVTITFTSEFPCAVKNIALYASEYDNPNDIPEFSKDTRYNLSDILDDFYLLYDDQVFYDDGTQRNKVPQGMYRLEGGKTLALPRSEPGSYVIYYQAYPASISTQTEDNYVLPLDPEVVVLLPVYMASVLYKDDDNGIATAYRNEFEIGLEALKQGNEAYGREVFYSESGWI